MKLPRRINQQWLDQQREAAKAAFAEGRVWCFRNADNFVRQHLILMLASEGIPYRVVDLGCGVKEITTDTSVCPRCRGTGKC